MNQKIRYFLRAAEEKSFSRAAQQIYVSPQALTKQITALEQEIGGELFTRSSRGIELTRLGVYAREQLGKVEREYTEVLETLKQRAHDGKEQIRIGIFSALQRDEMVTPLVSFLMASYPCYQISLEMLELEEGRKKLMSVRMDILLTNVHEQDNLFGYEGLSFGEHDVEVIVSLLHPWAIRDSITLEDMRRETFLKLKVDRDHYNVPLSENFYENIPCREVREVGNFETLMVLMRQAEGFAVFPMMFYGVENGQVRGFPYPGRALRYHTALLYHRDSRLTGLNGSVDDLREEFDLEPIPQGQNGM